ncbi:MAG: hypothetical protein H7039_24665 [Bryobacteraceae bacterium]|nr:hypothetical protein [Bryobacteraceae bacterium]
MSALATLACCLPLGIAGAAGALGLSVVLDSLRPLLIVSSLLLLAAGLVQLYRGQRQCRRSPASLIIFGVSASIVVAVLVFPQIVAEAMAALP